MDKISNLCEDVNIPDEFKNCLNDCFQVDIRNDLLDRRFNFLNLPILKKRMFDYNYILKDNFNSFIISTYQKEEAAKRLLKILPKKNDKEGYNNDLYDRQRNLFNLYQFYSKETYKYIEIDINDLNEGIWLYSNQYIYDIIIKIIEQYNNINSLSEYLQKNLEETFNSIRTFLKYSKKGKIIVNQNNEFSELYDGNTPLLYNEGKDIKESIPEKLKNISKYLGYDARKYLVHEKMGRPCSDNNVISYDSFCTKIDELIIEKYNDKNNYIKQDFKTAANILLEDYFDFIGENNAKKNFPKTFAIKDDILLNVIYNKQTRKDIAEFGKSYGSGTIKILLDNPYVVQGIINGEITDEKFKPKIKDNCLSDGESITENNNRNANKNVLIVQKENKKIKISYDKEINLDDNPSLFNEDIISNIIDYGDDLDFGNTVKKTNGNSGEAYIYELLLSSKKFKNVDWKMLGETGKGQAFEYR